MFIVALASHRYLGYVFVPYLVDFHVSCYVVRSLVRPADLGREGATFTEKEREIVRIAEKYSDSRLAKRFSREVSPVDFFTLATPDFVAKQIIPYVHRQMAQVLRCIREGNIPLYEKEAKYSHIYDEDLVRIPGENAGVTFSFRRSTEGTEYRLGVTQDGIPVKLTNRNVKVVTHDPCVLVLHNQLLEFDSVDIKKIQPFFSREVIYVKPETEPVYYRNFVAHIIRDHQVEAEGFQVVTSGEQPVPVLSLEPDLSYMPVLVLRFRYGPHECLSGESRKSFIQSEYNRENPLFYKYDRDSAWEKKIISLFTSRGLKEVSGTFTLPNLALLQSDEALHALVRWLSGNRKTLEENRVEVRQRFSDKEYFTGSQELRFEFRGGTDWFDVYAVVQIGDFSFPFMKLKRYLLNDIREFELPDGKIAVLPDEWFARYKPLIPFAKGDGNVIRFRKYHFTLLRENLPEVAPEVPDLLEMDSRSSEAVQLPVALKASLRNYQVEGFKWMYGLFRNGLGGCLADDMGLGKTLQTLALLLKIKKAKRISGVGTVSKTGQLDLFSEWEPAEPASLVLMPTSLVFNWSNEIKKFAPSLSVYQYIGGQRNFKHGAGNISDYYDVILTTYGTVRNDIEILKETDFFCVILDESQYIKNHASKSYKAVTELKARFRFVLTGTPVENSLSDLWSQMNFLNKGLLGSFQFFRQNFIIPIENQKEEEVISRLQTLIRPFILRRTKEEVAHDLPPLMEQTIFCPMTVSQESVYEREKSVIRNAILANIESNGIEKSSLVILKGMTRLRQIANHPRLVHAEGSDDSGKFTEIIQSLENLVAEKHKVLVFSSFVTHLELIREHLEQSSIKYSMLTGKSTKREEIIREFQEERQNYIFLISLKAGGVGLNLTSAEYVFILDPWWNPASEEQALSRAHRIGQDKHVFVYRFITEKSIEEKIELLKQKKSVLADQFINQNTPFRPGAREEVLSLFG